MKKTTLTLLAAALVAGAGAGQAQAQAQAQDRDDGWWRPAVLSLVEGVDRATAADDWWWRDGGSGDDRREDDRRYENRRDRDRDGRYAQRSDRRGNGPPFCRNGSGHPVHGMEWCVRKGWTRGHGPVWNRVGWEDVIFGGPAPNRDRYVRQPTLADILGDVVLGRLARHGHALGYDGALDARWMPTRAGSVLQLRMGGTPLAELTDANRDGRVDVVLLGGRR